MFCVLDILGLDSVFWYAVWLGAAVCCVYFWSYGVCIVMFAVWWCVGGWIVRCSVWKSIVGIRVMVFIVDWGVN